MTFQADVWLRTGDTATTCTIDTVDRPPASWRDDDVRQVLEEMLRAIHQLKHPSERPPYVVLRGISWIVNAYEQGGVLIAIEITLGAAVAGPFDIDKAGLEEMIARVIRRQTLPATPPATPPTVH
jgi:hypothetical protein